MKVDSRDEEVLRLARLAVAELTPRYVTRAEAENFDVTAQQWLARRRPALDGSSRAGALETSAVAVVLWAAQIAQDAVRDSAADALRSGGKRVWRTVRRKKNRAEEAEAVDLAERVCRLLVDAGIPGLTARIFADAVVASLDATARAHADSVAGTAPTADSAPADAEDSPEADRPE
jgi:hypothetical protein